MDTDYNIEEWAARTDKGRQVYNYNYHLAGKEFKGWALIRTVVLGEAKEMTGKAYILENLSNPRQEMLRIDIIERHDWRQAQVSLLNNLLESMRPNIPNGTKELAKIGDVNYVGLMPESDIPIAFSFTRGNIFLSINSVGDKSVDVSVIAHDLDEALATVPAKNKNKDRVRLLTPNEVSVKAQKPFVLIKNLRKIATPGIWLKIIVPDGELTRKGDDLQYVSAQEGKKQVNIFAINPE
jgi:hypothetical protein